MYKVGYIFTSAYQDPQSESCKTSLCKLKSVNMGSQFDSAFYNYDIKFDICQTVIPADKVQSQSTIANQSSNNYPPTFTISDQFEL